MSQDLPTPRAVKTAFATDRKCGGAEQCEVQLLPAHGLPTNIVPGEQIADTGNAAILQTLQTAAAREVVEVDLQEGDGWWLTRLLILVSAASRRTRLSRAGLRCDRCGGLRLTREWA